MSLNSNNNFKEAKLGPHFATQQLKEFKELIEAGISFVVMSMPGVGVSYFLKYLASQDFAYFVHVDLYSLPSLTIHEFYKLLLLELGGKIEKKSDEELLSDSKKALANLTEKWGKIVIIFSRFDQLKAEFDWNFLSNVQSFSTVVPDKIVLILTSVKPLNEAAPIAVSGGNLNFYSKTIYFKPYSQDDLKRLFLLDHTLAAHLNLDELIEASGGHIQLFNIILSSHKLKNLMLDQFVKQQLKSLIGYLDYQQSKQIQKIALGKKVEEVDEYLLGVGMVKASSFQSRASSFQLFSPLLAQYIKENLPVKLPLKEGKLFKLLKNHPGRIVSKEEIFAEVWPNSEEASDWALDALIYRLRKHPFMSSHGYIIESQKKVGYVLIQT